MKELQNYEDVFARLSEVEEMQDDFLKENQTLKEENQMQREALKCILKEVKAEQPNLGKM